VLSSSTDTHKATNGSADDKNPSSVAMDTKQAKRRLSWTVLTSCSKNSVWWYVRTHCNYCDTDSYTAGCWFGFPSVCGYVGVMHIVPPSCCVKIASNTSSVVDMPSVMPVENSQRKSKRTTDLYVKPGGNVAYVNNATKTNRSIVGGFDVPTSDKNVSDLPAADDKSAGTPTVNLPKVESSGGSKMSTVTDEVSSKPTHQKTEKLEHAATGSEQKIAAAAVTEDSKLAHDKQPAESQHKVTDDSGQLRDWSADEGSVDYELDDAAGAYQSCNGGGDEDGEQQPVQKLHSGKETFYMKLRNRIKAMELNLSLSSRFVRPCCRMSS
jgi:hypothetical protein